MTEDVSINEKNIEFRRKIKRKWWQFWKPKTIIVSVNWLIEEIDTSEPCICNFDEERNPECKAFHVYARTPILFKKDGKVNIKW